MRKEYDFSEAKRGAVVKPPRGKTRITIRIDDHILEAFKDIADKAGGASYQSLINEALSEYLSKKPEALESTLRRVIRDELKRAPSKQSPAAQSLAPHSSGRR